MGLTLRAYARHRGCSLTAVQKAIAAGRIVTEADGTIDAEKADAAWARNTRPGLRRARVPATRTERSRPADDSDRDDPAPLASRPRVDYAEQRAIREAYQARLAKLDYEERSGKLVRTDEVKVGWFNILRTLRDRILNLPDRHAAVLAAENDPTQVATMLMTELRDVLADVAEAVDGLGNRQ